jgi:Domain of unknown function (DUF4136)
MFKNPRAPLMALLSAAALLSGCATQLTTQVTAFHQLEAVTPQPLMGKTYKLLPNAEQLNSLEFRSYAPSIDSALVKAGLIDAGNAKADLIVAIAYGVSPTAADGYPRSGVGLGTGVGLGGGGGVSIGLGFPLAILSGANAGPNYRRELRLVIDRAPPAESNAAVNPSSRVYEATAVSEGKAPSLAPVLPAMVAALFTNFPGQTGQTQVIKSDCPENKLEC